MNLVDSSGWLEYLGEGANADFFASAIGNQAKLIVPTICIYEVFKRMKAMRGEEEATRAVGVMSLGELISLDRQIAMNAALLSVEFSLPLADSIILATARSRDAILCTQDAHFKGIDHVRFIEKRK